MQEFHFVEQNGWPVSAKQENSLSVLDVCNGSHVTISTERVLLTPSRLSPQTDNLPFKVSSANRYLSVFNTDIHQCAKIYHSYMYFGMYLLVPG